MAESKNQRGLAWKQQPLTTPTQTSEEYLFARAQKLFKIQLNETMNKLPQHYFPFVERIAKRRKEYARSVININSKYNKKEKRDNGDSGAELIENVNGGGALTTTIDNEDEKYIDEVYMTEIDRNWFKQKEKNEKSNRNDLKEKVISNNKTGASLKSQMDGLQVRQKHISSIDDILYDISKQANTSQLQDKSSINDEKANITVEKEFVKKDNNNDNTMYMSGGDDAVEQQDELSINGKLFEAQSHSTMSNIPPFLTPVIHTQGYGTNCISNDDENNLDKIELNDDKIDRGSAPLAKLKDDSIVTTTKTPETDITPQDSELDNYDQQGCVADIGAKLYSRKTTNVSSKSSNHDDLETSGEVELNRDDMLTTNGTNNRRRSIIGPQPPYLDNDEFRIIERLTNDPTPFLEYLFGMKKFMDGQCDYVKKFNLNGIREKADVKKYWISDLKNMLEILEEVLERLEQDPIRNKKNIGLLKHARKCAKAIRD